MVYSIMSSLQDFDPRMISFLHPAYLLQLCNWYIRAATKPDSVLHDQVQHHIQLLFYWVRGRDLMNSIKYDLWIELCTKWRNIRPCYREKRHCFYSTEWVRRSNTSRTLFYITVELLPYLNSSLTRHLKIIISSRGQTHLPLSRVIKREGVWRSQTSDTSLSRNRERSHSWDCCGCSKLSVPLAGCRIRPTGLDGDHAPPHGTASVGPELPLDSLTQTRFSSLTPVGPPFLRDRSNRAGYKPSFLPSWHHLGPLNACHVLNLPHPVSRAMLVWMLNRSH